MMSRTMMTSMSKTRLGMVRGKEVLREMETAMARMMDLDPVVEVGEALALEWGHFTRDILQMTILLLCTVHRLHALVANRTSMKALEIQRCRVITLMLIKRNRRTNTSINCQNEPREARE